MAFSEAVGIIREFQWSCPRQHSGFYCWSKDSTKPSKIPGKRRFIFDGILVFPFHNIYNPFKIRLQIGPFFLRRVIVNASENLVIRRPKKSQQIEGLFGLNLGFIVPNVTVL
jgi:hypothetical protein